MNCGGTSSDNYFPLTHVIPGGTNCIVTPYTDGYVMSPNVKQLYPNIRGGDVKESYNAGPPSLSGAVYPWNTGSCGCPCRPGPKVGVL